MQLMCLWKVLYTECVDACLRICAVMSGCASRGVFQTYVRQILIADYVIGAGASIRWRDRSHAGESNASSRGCGG